MKKLSRRKGFTLIEILLVVVIIGIMLAVIVPRAWRANIDTKYGLVRQSCNELASFGIQWAEQQIEAQTDESRSGMDDYLNSLAGHGPGGAGNQTRGWVARNATASNWTDNPGTLIDIYGRNSAVGNNPPENTVEATIAPEKQPRNPFNGTSVFAAANDPVTAGVPVPGAIAVRDFVDGQHNLYVFFFQGTDSTTTDITLATSFYAGMDPTSLQGIRNGIFMAKVAPTH